MAIKRLPLKDLVELYRALGDPVRLRLLSLLSGGEARVGELSAALGLPQSTTSRQLGRLRSSGLIRVRREGTSAWYSLRQREALDLPGALEGRLAELIPICAELRLDSERLIHQRLSSEPGPSSGRPSP
jgi:ArsR family transcriptional regulator